MNVLAAFARFWYEFVVGDDPLTAIVVIAAIAATAGLAHAGITAFWVIPVVVVALLVRGGRRP